MINSGSNTNSNMINGPVKPEPHLFKLCSYISSELLPSPLFTHRITWMKMNFGSTRFHQFSPVILSMNKY